MVCLRNGKESEGADRRMTPLGVSVDSVVAVAGLGGMASLDIEEVLDVGNVRVVEDLGPPHSNEKVSHPLDPVCYTKVVLRV